MKNIFYYSLSQYLKTKNKRKAQPKKTLIVVEKKKHRLRKAWQGLFLREELKE